MKQRLSKRAAEMTQGGIRAFFDKAAQYPDAIHLGIGEPDFPTPPEIIEAAERALRDGYTHYTPNAGLPEAREAAADYLARYGVRRDPAEEIIITCGGMGAVFAVLQCLVDPGSEVLIQDPQWVNYAAQIRLAGGVPVRVPVYEERDFRLQPEELERRITDRTKLLILNSPNNPTGMVLTEEELAAIGSIACRHDLLVLSDEVYCELLYGGARFHSIGAIPEMAERTVIVNSTSKTFAMTGWRVGFAAGPREIIRKMTVLQENMVSCAPAAGQAAAAYAFRHMPNVRQMRAVYEARRDLLLEGLNAIPGIACRRPDGAFYAFPNIRGTGLTSLEFCERLLEQQHVVVIPGSSFGSCGEGYVRLAYANSEEALRQALQRIRRFSPCAAKS